VAWEAEVALPGPATWKDSGPFAEQILLCWSLQVPLWTPAPPQNTDLGDLGSVPPLGSSHGPGILLQDNYLTSYVVGCWQCTPQALLTLRTHVVRRQMGLGSSHGVNQTRESPSSCLCPPVTSTEAKLGQRAAQAWGPH
jgi:hypothetical protein